MVEEAIRQIRTISHPLHPPLLDEAGLASALHWYVEGFSERSKINARLEIPQAFAGLSKEMELSILRVVQECLTNIHRHAGSSTAEIRITQDEACLRVEIEDAGKGIPGKRSRPRVVGSRWRRASRNAGTSAAVRWNSANPLERRRHTCDCHSTRSTCHGYPCSPGSPSQGRSDLMEVYGEQSAAPALKSAAGIRAGTLRY
jgi:hypothetical protein